MNHVDERDKMNREKEILVDHIDFMMSEIFNLKNMIIKRGEELDAGKIDKERFTKMINIDIAAFETALVLFQPLVEYSLELFKDSPDKNECVLAVDNCIKDYTNKKGLWEV